LDSLVGPIPENRSKTGLSDRFSGIFFPGIDVVPSRKSGVSGVPCKQIILDIAPVFLSDYGTDN